MPLLNAVIETNQRQPLQIIQLLRKHFATLKNVKISILGLSFKPDTDDVRESPAINIINLLLNEGAILTAYDPVANNEARKLFPSSKLTLCPVITDALESADAIVLVTRWSEFKRVPELLSKYNPDAIVIDGRRMLDKTTLPKYEGIGLA